MQRHASFSASKIPTRNYLPRSSAFGPKPMPVGTVDIAQNNAPSRIPFGDLSENTSILSGLNSPHARPPSYVNSPLNSPLTAPVRKESQISSFSQLVDQHQRNSNLFGRVKTQAAQTPVAESKLRQVASFSKVFTPEHRKAAQVDSPKLGTPTTNNDATQFGSRKDPNPTFSRRVTNQMGFAQHQQVVAAMKSNSRSSAYLGRQSLIETLQEQHGSQLHIEQVKAKIKQVQKYVQVLSQHSGAIQAHKQVVNPNVNSVLSTGSNTPTNSDASNHTRRISFTENKAMQQSGVSKFDMANFKHSLEESTSSKNPLLSRNGPAKMSRPSQYMRKASLSTFQAGSLSFNGGVRQPRTTIMKLDDFVIGKQLGKGKYGHVSLVKHKESGFICAMKSISRQLIQKQKIENQMVRELKIHSYISHPNLIELYGFFFDDNYLHILMEMSPGGHLYSLIQKNRRIEQRKAAYLARQIVDAVGYLHANRILHRDIKPENITVTNGVVKLCDFGWAVHCGGGLRETVCGTPLYLSPEMLKGEMYDQGVDNWAVGMIIYEMLYGQLPFKILNENELTKIVTDQIKFPNYINVSAEAKDFILKLLEKDPAKRVDMAELLCHSFLKDTDKPQEFLQI